VLASGQQVVDITKEASVRAQAQRPSVALWGNSRRPNFYINNNVVLSFTADLYEWVKPLYNDLRLRGFPVWMDQSANGAQGIQGLESAAMLVSYTSLLLASTLRACY
jgi:hypothetical protein